MVILFSVSVQCHRSCVYRGGCFKKGIWSIMWTQKPSWALGPSEVDPALARYLQFMPYFSASDDISDS